MKSEMIEIAFELEPGSHVAPYYLIEAIRSRNPAYALWAAEACSALVSEKTPDHIEMLVRFHGTRKPEPGRESGYIRDAGDRIVLAAKIEGPENPNATIVELNEDSKRRIAILARSFIRIAVLKGMDSWGFDTRTIQSAIGHPAIAQALQMIAIECRPFYKLFSGDQTKELRAYGYRISGVAGEDNDYIRSTPFAYRKFRQRDCAPHWTSSWGGPVSGGIPGPEEIVDYYRSGKGEDGELNWDKAIWMNLLKCETPVSPGDISILSMFSDCYQFGASKQGGSSLYETKRQAFAPKGDARQPSYRGSGGGSRQYGGDAGGYGQKRQSSGFSGASNAGRQGYGNAGGHRGGASAGSRTVDPHRASSSGHPSGQPSGHPSSGGSPSGEPGGPAAQFTYSEGRAARGGSGFGKHMPGRRVPGGAGQNPAGAAAAGVAEKRHSGTAAGISSGPQAPSPSATSQSNKAPASAESDVPDWLDAPPTYDESYMG